MADKKEIAATNTISLNTISVKLQLSICLVLEKKSF